MVIGCQRSGQGNGPVKSDVLTHEDRSRNSANNSGRATGQLVLWLSMGVYASMLLITRPLSFGDTIFYVQTILASGAHPDANGVRSLFDFGHLLWRPLGWAVFEFLKTISVLGLGGGERILIAKILICISVVSGAIATALLHMISRDLGLRPSASFVLCATFIFSNAVIYAAQTGLSYMLGLAFLMAALWFTMRRTPMDTKSIDRGLWWGGIFVALSAASWFPFILVAPAIALAAAVPWDNPELFSISRLSLIRAGKLTCASGAAAIIIFGAAARVLHINSVGGIKAWVSESSHGWRQSSNLLRLGMGIPRCCVALKDDAGIIWKRFFFHDPYAPVRLHEFLQGSLMLMVIFYSALLLLLYTLSRSTRGKVLLFLLTSAALPVVYFSVFMFEPGSIERFLPLFPFYFVALGHQLDCAWPNRKQRILGFIYPVVLIVFSLATYNDWSVERHWEPAQSRLEALSRQLPSESTVALLANWDDLFLFAKDNLLHDTFSQSLNLWIVLQPAHERIFTWRQRFAARVLEAWQEQTEMWLSERLLAKAPLPEWGWVEGDDRAIRWVEVPEFCRQFQYDKKIGEADGFVRLARTESNQILLERVVAYQSKSLDH